MLNNQPYVCSFIFYFSQWWPVITIPTSAGSSFEVWKLPGLRPRSVPLKEGASQPKDRSFLVLASQVQRLICCMVVYAFTGHVGYMIWCVVWGMFVYEVFRVSGWTGHLGYHLWWVLFCMCVGKACVCVCACTCLHFWLRTWVKEFQVLRRHLKRIHQVLKRFYG